MERDHIVVENSTRQRCFKHAGSKKLMAVLRHIRYKRDSISFINVVLTRITAHSASSQRCKKKWRRRDHIVVLGYFTSVEENRESSEAS